MITPQFRHCDCKIFEWLHFGIFFKLPCIVQIYAWFFMHCRNHHSDNHTNHVIKQAGTPRPELDHNTGRHFDTPLRLVTSRPSFRQTRHLASHNISTVVHETSKFRYNSRESWCNCVWKTLHLIFTQLASVEIHLRPFPHHGLSRDHVVRHPRQLAEHPLRIVWLPFTIAGEVLVF